MSKELVEKGNKVKVEYTGSFPDGEVFDKSEGRGPLEFVAGSGQVVQGFDDAVVGMKLKEEKEVTIPPEKAYGKEEDVQKFEVPVEQIGGGEAKVGSELMVAGGMPAKVTEIKDGIATIEIKHPLAGKTLVFKLKVVGIEECKDDEGNACSCESCGH